MEPPGSLFPKGGNSKGIYEHPAGEKGASDSTRMEHIAPTSATHPMTQVGYAAIYLQCYKKGWIPM